MYEMSRVLERCDVLDPHESDTEDCCRAKAALAAKPLIRSSTCNSALLCRCKDMVKKLASTPEGKAFLLCEFGKAVDYMLTGNSARVRQS